MKRSFLLFCVLFSSYPAVGDEITVAIAANFLGTFERIKSEFERQSGHRVKVASGSTGKLYALIKQGAPYDVFLAARGREPKLLEQEGLIENGTRFVYARGRLVLWSKNHAELGSLGMKIFFSNPKLVVAIANPDTAPYGAAAIEAMSRSQIEKPYSFRVVRAEDVGQAFLYATTNNVDLAFIAASQAHDSKNQISGYEWVVPQNLYTPIEQEGGVLASSRNKKAAADLVNYLRSDDVKKKLVSFGYSIGEE